ncbi:hypothetical protein [Deinococcus sp. QL22]|uniref:hypothetical protein n=1 Tax=Deinococcus sp. QL22 TaxID=2939437 RepID=UPI002016CDAD|nr:hypothetical protein [Deinococcus sp. QL22]UQN10692.1 hypothetical protein M1R55_30440 [Deinococcus sp. QL22]
MQRALLCLLPVLLLACRTPPLPQSGTPATRENLLATIDATPAPLALPRPADLGTDLSIQGPVQFAFRVGDPVYLTGNGTGEVWGQITGSKQARVRLPTETNLPRLPLLSLIREFIPSSLCAVDTLKASLEAEYFTPEFYARTPGTFSAGLEPQTSPMPLYGRLYPAVISNEKNAFLRTGILLHLQQDVKVQGELRCVFEYGEFVEDATQYGLSVNVDLKAGWNVLRQSYLSTPRARGGSVEIVISGAAQDYNTLVTIGE